MEAGPSNANETIAQSLQNQQARAGVLYRWILFAATDDFLTRYFSFFLHEIHLAFSLTRKFAKQRYQLIRVMQEIYLHPWTNAIDYNRD